MSYWEQSVVFDCEGERLVGVVSRPLAEGEPEQHAMDIGVVVIVGGPQYRIGSHRQFLQLARRLASAGYPVMRFDVRGMGDSTGELHTFETISPDVGAAIDALQLCAPQVRRVALWGLCDGASAALLYCDEAKDARVAGLCLLNPWVRSEASLARAHVKHYYGDRLKQREFWVKLFSGRVAWGALTGLARNVRTALSKPTVAAVRTQMPFQDRMAAAWEHFDAHIFLFLSGADYTAKEFKEYVASNAAWKQALYRPRLMQCGEPEADHTLSQRRFSVSVENRTLEFLNLLKT